MSKTVGNYTLVEKLGQGSYATVYKAHHKVNGGDYAVKVISRQRIGSEKLQRNLEQEISIMKEITNENVVRLYGTFTSKNNIYLVLEYCGGGDLQLFIRKHKRLEEIVALKFLIQMARGLKFLHSKNVIHRDIKPQNLLLSEFSPNAIIKFADFGFAKHLHEAALAQTPCGTPLYMAPEIFEMKEYDAKADVWSIGCVLFEMCVGEPPFKGTNHRELYKCIQSNTGQLSKNFALSSDVTAILMRLLELKPERRVSLDKLHHVMERLATDIDNQTNSVDSAKVSGKLDEKETTRPDGSGPIDCSSWTDTQVTPPLSEANAKLETTDPNPNGGTNPVESSGSGSSSGSGISSGSGSGSNSRRKSGDLQASAEGQTLRRVRSREKVMERYSPTSVHNSLQQISEAHVTSGSGNGGNIPSMTPATATMLVKLANPGSSPNSERILLEHVPISSSSAVAKALSSTFASGDSDDEKVGNQKDQTNVSGRNNVSPRGHGSPYDGNRYLRSSPGSGRKASAHDEALPPAMTKCSTPPTAFGRDSDDFVVIDDPGCDQPSSTWKNSEQLSGEAHEQDQSRVDGTNSAQQQQVQVNTMPPSSSGRWPVAIGHSQQQQDLQSSEIVQLSHCSYRCQYISSIVAAITKHADSLVKDIIAKYGKAMCKELEREDILGLGKDNRAAGGPEMEGKDRELSPRNRSSTSSSGGDSYNAFSMSNQQLNTHLQMLSDALCLPFSLYLHSMNYIQDAIQRTEALKKVQFRPNTEPIVSLSETPPGVGEKNIPLSPSSYFLKQIEGLIVGLTNRFNQLMSRAEGCQKWIRTDATYPVPEPLIYQAALKLGQEAAVQELLGNLKVLVIIIHSYFLLMVIHHFYCNIELVITTGTPSC